MRFPAEIRPTIYRQLMVASEPVTLHHEPSPSLPTSVGEKGYPLCAAVLRVSRQISAEAINVFYGGNTFAIDLWFSCVAAGAWIECFSEENRLRMRHVRLLATMPVTSAPDRWVHALFPEKALGTPIWEPILSRLTRLDIGIRVSVQDLLAVARRARDRRRLYRALRDSAERPASLPLPALLAVNRWVEIAGDQEGLDAPPNVVSRRRQRAYIQVRRVFAEVWEVSVRGDDGSVEESETGWAIETRSVEYSDHLEPVLFVFLGVLI